MDGFNAPWCFGGGWAIDGFLGRMTRPHDDVDIVIWRNDQLLCQRHFLNWEWEYYINREARPWSVGEFLNLPIHNAHAHYNTQHLEMLMLEREENEWWFRRNHDIRMPKDRVMIPTSFGFNVLNPAVALLFKSNRLDEKDQHDFDYAYDRLSIVDQNWLNQSLSIINPDHPWIINTTKK